jgi:hypothetical protein
VINPEIPAMKRGVAMSLRHVVVVSSLVASACAGANENQPSATRETLPDGTLLLTYRGLSSAAPDTLHPDLRIGKKDGLDWETFGSITGIESGPDGSIYVLDFQAAAVRVFDADGQYIRTIGRRGEGPGEFRQPLGLLSAPNETIWVRDQGSRMILVMSTDGGEIKRHPQPMTGAGSNQWDGVIDNEGILWQSWRHIIQAPPPTGSVGLTEGKRAYYVRSFNPVTTDQDSVFVADEVVRILNVRQDPGYASSRVPFDPDLLIAIDREGAIWSARTNSYRLTRAQRLTNSRLTVESDVAGPPITAEVKQEWESLLSEAQVGLNIPTSPRAIVRIFADDKNQLWVQRQVSPAEPACFDIYSPQGDWLGTVLLNERLAQLPAPVVRGGYLYAVTLGELDVPSVMRARLPRWVS